MTNKKTLKRVLRKALKLSVKPIRTKDGRYFTIAGVADKVGVVSLLGVLGYAFVKMTFCLALLAGYVLFAS